MSFTAQHAKALSKVRKANNVAVVFTKNALTAYDPSTDVFDDEETSALVGYAIELPGDIEQYTQELDITRAITLFFVPKNIGHLPNLDDHITWSGEDRTVKYIRPIRPAGIAIAAKVVIQ